MKVKLNFQEFVWVFLSMANCFTLQPVFNKHSNSTSIMSIIEKDFGVMDVWITTSFTVSHDSV